MSFPNAVRAQAIIASVKTLDKLPIFKFSYKCETNFTPNAATLPGSQLYGEYGDETRTQVE